MTQTQNYKNVMQLLNDKTNKEISKILNLKISYVRNVRWMAKKAGLLQTKIKQTPKDRVRKHSYKKKYGITIKEYEEMFSAQNGKCAICKNTTKIYLSVDHDHKSGKIRALVCQPCNLLLGNAREDKNILTLAIEYLKQFEN